MHLEQPLLKGITMLRYWMIAIAGTAMLGAASLNVSAAPASNAADLRAAHQRLSPVGQVARRCWWRNGERRCASLRSGTRVYGYRNYGDGYRYNGGDGYAYPEELPTGSTAWWRSMDFYDRGGFGGPGGR